MSTEDVRREFEGQLESQRNGTDEPGAGSKFDPPYMPRLVREYLDLVVPTTSAAPVFHYASFMTVAALVLGPHVSLANNPRFHPNFYTLLLGPSRMSHKSTAMEYALSLLPDVGAAHYLLRGVVSIEGMARLVTDKVRPRLMLTEDELSNLCAAQARGATSNVFPRLCELYAQRPTFELNAKERVVLTEPFACFLCGVTRKFLREREARGAAGLGFFNRCFVAFGAARKPLHDWIWPDPAVMTHIARRLGEIAETLSEKPARLSCTPAAKERGVKWLDQWYDRALERANVEALFNPESNNLLRRFEMLATVLDGESEIGVAQTEHAIAVIDQTEPAALAEMDISRPNIDRDAEDWCENHIPIGRTSMRTLQRVAHRAIATSEILKVVRAWAGSGRGQTQAGEGKRGPKGIDVVRYW